MHPQLQLQLTIRGPTILISKIQTKQNIIPIRCIQRPWRDSVSLRDSAMTTPGRRRCLPPLKRIEECITRREPDTQVQKAIPRVLALRRWSHMEGSRVSGG